MTGTPPGQDSDAEAVREEAAAWIARLQGDPSAEQRADLARWLAADPRHLAVYQRAFRRFENARILGTSKRYRPRHSGGSRRVITSAIVLAAASAVAMFVWLPLGDSNHSGRDARQSPVAAIDSGGSVQNRRYTTDRGDISEIRLADGSILTLDTASTVAIDFDRSSRRLALLHGRARFSVSRNARPFIVSAGGGSVTAMGTMFDVALEPDGAVRVLLLEGVVDVKTVGGLHPDRPPVSRRLSSGEEAAFRSGRLIDIPSPVFSLGEASWPDGTVDFNDVSLAHVLNRANRYADRPITLSSPDLAELRVSGRFRIKDSERLAANLAKLLDLRSEPGQDVIILDRHPSEIF